MLRDADSPPSKKKENDKKMVTLQLSFSVFVLTTQVKQTSQILWIGAN